MKIIATALLLIALGGCARQLKLGAEIEAPYGCVEARARGHDC